MVEKTKGNEKRTLKAGVKPKGKSKLGLTCIGEVCFTEDVFLIKLAEDADPECARKTAELILRGAEITFEVSGKGIVKNENEQEKVIADEKGN